MILFLRHAGSRSDRRRTVGVALVALIAAGLVWAGAASAKQMQHYFYSGTSFNGALSSAGIFQREPPSRSTPRTRKSWCSTDGSRRTSPAGAPKFDGDRILIDIHLER